MRLLARQLQLRTPNEVLDLAKRIVGRHRLSAAAAFFVHAALEGDGEDEDGAEGRRRGGRAR